MELNETHKKALEVSKTIRKVLPGRVSTTEIYDVVDVPNRHEFKIKFVAYDYFVVIFQYELGIIGCAIECGKNHYLSLVDGQHCFSEVNLDEYFEEVKKNLELRIPDKFLKAKGWL